jgi:hypothetical protein
MSQPSVRSSPEETPRPAMDSIESFDDVRDASSVIETTTATGIVVFPVRGSGLT